MQSSFFGVFLWNDPGPGDAGMWGVAAAALRVDAPHYPVIAPLLLTDPAVEKIWKQKTTLGGGFKHFLFSPLFREDFQSD